MKLFRETVNLENALKSQITEALDRDYIEELRDTTSNTFNDDILTILTYLMTNYGDVLLEVPNKEEW